VRIVGKITVIIFALSLFASPLMACLLPDSTLTAEEHECCRRMAGKCGEMPSSHSCCKIAIRDTDQYLSNSRTLLVAPAPLTIACLPVKIGLPEHISLFVSLAGAHAPPESPPLRTSILRI
jgi:hypothetical protein